MGVEAGFGCIGLSHDLLREIFFYKLLSFFVFSCLLRMQPNHFFKARSHPPVRFSMCFFEFTPTRTTRATRWMKVQIHFLTIDGVYWKAEIPHYTRWHCTTFHFWHPLITEKKKRASIYVFAKSHSHTFANGLTENGCCVW